MAASAVAVLAILLGFYAYSSLRVQAGAPGVEQSGPISNFPSSWGLYGSCPGFGTAGNMTTLGLGRPTYPGSWNTTTIVTLDQVYQSIIGSTTFRNVTSGHGWVVYSWLFSQGGSGNMPPSSNDIMAYFILTDGAAPNGYLTAFYDIQNGGVQVGDVTGYPVVVCPTVTTG